MGHLILLVRMLTHWIQLILLVAAHSLCFDDLVGGLVICGVRRIGAKACDALTFKLRILLVRDESGTELRLRLIMTS